MADANVQNYLITVIIAQILNEPRMYEKGFQPSKGWKPCGERHMSWLLSTGF